MSNKVFLGQEQLGRIWLPEISISRPGGPVVMGRLSNICVASVIRAGETQWANITHNERVDLGASIQYNRLLGTTGTTAALGVFTSIALGKNSFTKTKTDIQMGSNSALSTSLTNEINTTVDGVNGTGLTRGTADTVAGYSAPASLGAVASGTLVKTFTFTGTAPSTSVTGSAIFDGNTLTTGNMWCEALFTDAGQTATGGLSTNDQVVITWTYAG